MDSTCTHHTVLAFDMGSSHGRGVLVSYDTSSNTCTVDEVHHFTNPVQEQEGILCWDSIHWINEIKIGIKKAYIKNNTIQSIGIDTWGCDYAWLDAQGNTIGSPRCYQAKIASHIIDEVHSKIPLSELYAINGNAFFPFNTVYKVYFDIVYADMLIKGAKQILFTPNLLMYFLTGEKCWEYTIASTSGLMDARNRTWADAIFNRLGIPRDIVGNISKPCEHTYPLTQDLMRELEIPHEIPVTCIASHDSAAAVIGAGVNANSAYLINGTWSLIGIETEDPIIHEEGVNLGLVNEGSTDNKIRFLNLMMGMGIFQKLRKEWNGKGVLLDYADFSVMGRSSDEEGLIHITNEFIFPDSIEHLIKSKYYEKYRRELTGRERITKLVYNTLANQYKNALKLIEKHAHKQIDNVILVGGGIQDALLVESIKKYSGKKITLGPVESSVVGNAVCQFVALGVFENMAAYKNKAGDIQWNR